MGIDFAPLWAAPWFVQVHALAALIAIPLGAWQFAAPKGTLPHKVTGAAWIALMVAVTVSSAFILRPAAAGAPFWERLSPIHVFTVTTAIGILGGIAWLTMGGEKLKNHKHPFVLIYIGGLLIAGAFTLVPGRIMHEVVFGAG